MLRRLNSDENIDKVQNIDWSVVYTCSEFLGISSTTLFLIPCDRGGIANVET